MQAWCARALEKSAKQATRGLSAFGDATGTADGFRSGATMLGALQPGHGEPTTRSALSPYLAQPALSAPLHQGAGCGHESCARQRKMNKNQRPGDQLWSQEKTSSRLASGVLCGPAVRTRSPQTRTGVSLGRVCVAKATLSGPFSPRREDFIAARDKQRGRWCRSHTGDRAGGMGSGFRRVAEHR